MRWVAGFLLIAAAGLKAIEIVTEPAATLVHPLGRHFVPVEIGIEFGLGLLLLSGLYWRTLRWLVIVIFTAFAAYSLYLAMNGAESCGCFGSLHISPWWTFGMDSIVVFGLLVAMLLERRSLTSRSEPWEGLFARKASHQRFAFAVLTAATLLSIALNFRYISQRTGSSNGLTSVGDLVVLEPEQWIGQKLPITKSVDLDLSSGDWVVLLHRHDCPVCQEMIPKFEQRAAAGERIALVEVPPYGNFESHFATRERACHYGRLKEDHEWFVQTPVEIRLQGGIVTAVKTRDH